MLGESISSLAIVAVKAAMSYYKTYQRSKESDDTRPDETYDADADPVPEEHQVPRLWWLGGLGASTILCVAVTSPMFNMPVYEPIVAVIVACLTSVLAVRALGETDLSPVSGIGKVCESQSAFRF